MSPGTDFAALAKRAENHIASPPSHHHYNEPISAGAPLCADTIADQLAQQNSAEADAAALRSRTKMVTVAQTLISGQTIAVTPTRFPFKFSHVFTVNSTLAESVLPIKHYLLQYAVPGVWSSLSLTLTLLTLSLTITYNWNSTPHPIPLNPLPIPLSLRHPNLTIILKMRRALNAVPHVGSS